MFHLFYLVKINSHVAEISVNVPNLVEIPRPAAKICRENDIQYGATDGSSHLRFGVLSILFSWLYLLFY